MPGKKRTAPSDGTSTAKDAKKPKKDGKDNKTGKKKEKAKATEKKTAQDNEAVPFVRRKGMKNGSKLATGKKYPGGHVSAAGNHVQSLFSSTIIEIPSLFVGGVHNAFDHASSMSAGSMALFVKNQRQWKAKELEDEEVQKFKEAMKVSFNRYTYLLACFSQG